MKFKRMLQRRLTYKPKNIINKHKHNYLLPYVLEITNKNPHATSDNYNKHEYYNVVKCDLCDSFIPDDIEGNIFGYIIDGKYDKKKPLIKASTNMKGPAYNFDNLYDVFISDE